MSPSTSHPDVTFPTVKRDFVFTFETHIEKKKKDLDETKPTSARHQDHVKCEQCRFVSLKSVPGSADGAVAFFLMHTMIVARSSCKAPQVN